MQDTGRGLTKEEKRRLFGRFSQATPRTHAQYGGSGLGLFISRQLTELHGGQIGVGSEAGVGSNFAFYIRCRRTTGPPNMPKLHRELTPTATPVQMLKDRLPIRVASMAPDNSVPSPTRKDIDWKHIHILIVEDNVVNQKVLSRQLAKLGCNVTIAEHGGYALAHIEKTQFWHGCEQTGNILTIVLMDLEMPVMDGLTCVKAIRELEQQGKIIKHIPVIAVTANVRSELVAVAKASGMVSHHVYSDRSFVCITRVWTELTPLLQDDMVSKPFRIPELMAKMSEVLNR